jgi:hypothetical protein
MGGNGSSVGRREEEDGREGRERGGRDLCVRGPGGDGVRSLRGIRWDSS